jgi:hypothetical protein
VSEIEGLAAGQKITIPASGTSQAFVVTRTATGLSIAAAGVPTNGVVHAAYGVCTAAVAAAVWALGAAVIGLAASMGWTIVVAGMALGPEVLGILAAGMGSYAALEGLVAIYVC